MNSKITIWGIIFFVSSILNVFSDEKISVGVNEYAPLISKNMKYNGVMIRVLSEIFAMENIKVELRWVPWKRAYVEVQKGRIDITPCWSKNNEREKEVNYSSPLYEVYHVFFQLKSNPIQWKTFDDLKGIAIGATVGYFYGDEFKNAEKDKKINVEYVSSDTLNFRKLIAGRISLLAINKITGYHLARQSLKPEQIDLIMENPKPVSKPGNHYVLFSKNKRGKRLLKIFNNRLKQLKESGKFDKYFEESKQGEYDLK